MSQNSHAQVPVFILAGGRGTRLSEETHAVPKPMIEIGDTPILIHLMRSYYSAGFNDFVILAGYRQWEIKQYFLNYGMRARHLEVDHREVHSAVPRPFGSSRAQESWRVRVVDTGLDCMTGGRLARGLDLIAQEQDFEQFALTYGDGLSDVDLSGEFAFHRAHGKIGTVLGVRPLARFGELDVDGQEVRNFLEKPQSRQGLINGGFFFFQKSFRSYLSDDESCILEREPVTRLAQDRQLMLHPHEGFWQPMDTLRDKTTLQALWESGKAPWSADALG